MACTNLFNQEHVLERAEWKKKIHVVNCESFRIDFVIVVIVVYGYLSPYAKVMFHVLAPNFDVEHSHNENLTNLYCTGTHMHISISHLMF